MYNQQTSAAFGLPEGFDHAAFQGAQKRTESLGTQITPDEFYSYAGYKAGQDVPQSLRNTYSQLYKHTSFYNPDGSFTSAAPASAITFPRYQSPGTYQPQESIAKVSDYIPQNIQGSPLYEWQRSEGEKALARMASARGYTNSGREQQGVADLVNRLTAEESERIRQQAAIDAQRENERRVMNTQLGNQYTFGAARDANNYNTTQANLFSNLALDSADRQERLSNTQFDRLMTVINSMLGQSPFDAGVNANSNAASAVQQNATAAAGILGQLGSAVASGIRPQYSPDNSGSNAFNIYGNYSNSVNNGRLFSDFLGSFF